MIWSSMTPYGVAQRYKQRRLQGFNHERRGSVGIRKEYQPGLWTIQPPSARLVGFAEKWFWTDSTSTRTALPGLDRLICDFQDYFRLADHSPGDAKRRCLRGNRDFQRLLGNDCALLLSSCG
jgi:hypothetical protein